MNNEQIIEMEEVLGNFNFERVILVMQALDWEWHNVGVPSLGDVKKEGRRLLRDAIERKAIISTGGFRAEYNEDYGASLTFEAETAYSQ